MCTVQLLPPTLPCLWYRATNFAASNMDVLSLGEGAIAQQHCQGSLTGAEATLLHLPYYLTKAKATCSRHLWKQ